MGDKYYPYSGIEAVIKRANEIRAKMLENERKRAGPPASHWPPSPPETPPVMEVSSPWPPTEAPKTPALQKNRRVWPPERPLQFTR